MTTECLAIRDLTFVYESASSPVFEGLSVRLPVGWTGVIGPNGSGKTTLLCLACGELAAARGRIESPDRLVYCPQRTDDPPEELARFVEATDSAACELRGRLGVGGDWPDRWGTLSHGERKRSQIAVALWRAPGVLAVDEPTNHIDLEARRLLADAMRTFAGVGLLVSHDRDLLDRLCSQCLFIEPPGAELRPGGYTKAVALAGAEQAQARRARSEAKQALSKLQTEATAHRRLAGDAHRLRSKRKIPMKDHDAKQRIGLARYTGKDGQAGRLLRQMDGRLRQARQKLANTHVKKQQSLGVDMRGVLSQRDALFRLPPGSLALGAERRLAFPELVMAPQDRVALTGPNGSGKSTLVRHVVGQLPLPRGKFVYMAQEIDRQTGVQVVNAARQSPHDRLGQVMSTISCLGSDPRRLLDTDEPSPGELRKLVLALGMADQPELIVMDEPTNHLDLPSIECLESALAECPCGLLLVSHDQRFLQRLTRTRWDITFVEDGPAVARLSVVQPKERG